MGLSTGKGYRGLMVLVGDKREIRDMDKVEWKRNIRVQQGKYRGVMMG